MLRQAMMARCAFILLDGLDEAGRLNEAISRHVAEVMAPQGHVLLATSRPLGVEKEKLFSQQLFNILRLGPLTVIVGRGAKSFTERAHALVNERTEGRAIIAFELGMVDVVVLVALEVVFPAAMAAPRCKREVDEDVHEDQWREVEIERGEERV